VQKQRTLADGVFVVYEAGPGGFHLHRQLTALGVTAFVVQPQKLDPQHKGVVTGKTDARELTLNLDRYLRGNQRLTSGLCREVMLFHRLALHAEQACWQLGKRCLQSSSSTAFTAHAG